MGSPLIFVNGIPLSLMSEPRRRRPEPGNRTPTANSRQLPPKDSSLASDLDVGRNRWLQQERKLRRFRQASSNHFAVFLGRKINCCAMRVLRSTPSQFL